MSAERYRQLALGEDADSAVAPMMLTSPRALSDSLSPVLASCARCHGAQGGGRGTGAFPILAGQNQAYLLASLRAYASADRASGVMQPIAAALNDNVLQQLAEHYATLPPIASRGAAKSASESIARGKKLAAIGKREQKVPSCVHCHGPSEKERNRMYPVLAGQYPDYLALQLRLFTAGERGGTEYAQIMHSAAQRLTPEQIRDLAAFYASLTPSTAP
jgi:cytochrome c553